MTRTTFDICVPTYNEAAIIADSLAILTDALGDTMAECGIIVSDDGSTDETASIVLSLKQPGVRVLPNQHRGKGAAITSAAASSVADIFGFIDADLSADPHDLEKLVSLVQSQQCDIAIGSRLLETNRVDRGPLRTGTSIVFNWLRKRVLGIRVEDSQCGLKVMNVAARKLLANCSEKGWFLDLQFLYKAEKNGLVIREVPIGWVEHRLKGHESRLRYIPDGLSGIWAMIKIRLGD